MIKFPKNVFLPDFEFMQLCEFLRGMVRMVRPRITPHKGLQWTIVNQKFKPANGKAKYL